jgi:hypothetical protein
MTTSKRAWKMLRKKAATYRGSTEGDIKSIVHSGKSNCRNTIQGLQTNRRSTSVELKVSERGFKDRKILKKI